MLWTFNFTGKIKAGIGVAGELGVETAALGRRAVVVAGRHLINSGAASHLKSLLFDAGVEAVLISGPPAEPTLDDIAAALSKARNARAMVIVGVGGGSVLDTAKAVAGLYGVPGEPAKVVEDMLYGRRPEPERRQVLPWVAVPTTAGTGSETTHVAVVTDTGRGIKQSMRSNNWFARVVLIDPMLYTSAPQKVTACSGMDALTQAIESHTALYATLVTKALSSQAASLISRNLIRSYRAGDDLEAREAMAVGSCLAGIALANARLGLVHGIAHPIGVRYKIAHGLACAVLLPYVMRFNLSAAGAGYAELAQVIGIADAGPMMANRLIEMVEEMNRQMQIPKKLSEIGLKEKDIPEVIEQTLPSGSTKANPKAVGGDDIAEILAANL
jgi:alcohol dehydrogenase class IV